MGFYFVEKQHLENATDSPSISKVLCINRKIAHNDNTEALKDTKGLPESRSQIILNMVLISFFQSYNIPAFDKPDNHPNITLSNT